jgi:hypothetical protein
MTQDRDTPMRQRAVAVIHEEVVPANDDIRVEPDDPVVDGLPSHVTLATLYRQSTNNADAIHRLATDVYRNQLNTNERFDELLTAVGAHPKPRFVPPAPAHPTTDQALSIPPPRGKLESIADLVEQVTYEGTRVRVGTDEQLRQVIKTHVHEAVRLSKVEEKAALVDDVKAQSKRAFWALVGLGLATVFTAVITRIKGLWH